MRGLRLVATLGVLLLATAVPPAVPQTRLVETAVVLPVGRALDGPPIFTFRRVTTGDANQRVVRVTFTAPDAEPALDEIVTYVGGRVARYESIQHQIDDRATLTVRGDRAVSERMTGGGRTSYVRSTTGRPTRCRSTRSRTKSSRETSRTTCWRARDCSR
jgi:hypothetical protein